MGRGVLIAALITVMMISPGPPARMSASILLAQVLGLLAWFTIYLWWVLRKRTASPPAVA